MATQFSGGRQILDGSIALADLSATGTPSSANFLRGDNTWATPSATGAVTGQATVDFGANTTQDGNASVTIATASALTASIITITPSGVATATHDPDDYMVEGITASVGNIVNGVSFDILAFAPNNTFGTYKFNYLIN